MHPKFGLAGRAGAAFHRIVSVGEPQGDRAGVLLPDGSHGVRRAHRHYVLHHESDHGLFDGREIRLHDVVRGVPRGVPVALGASAEGHLRGLHRGRSQKDSDVRCALPGDLPGGQDNRRDLMHAGLDNGIREGEPLAVASLVVPCVHADHDDSAGRLQTAAKSGGADAADDGADENPARDQQLHLQQHRPHSEEGLQRVPSDSRDLPGHQGGPGVEARMHFESVQYNKGEFH